MEKNLLLIISGPAGSGKNTVAERMMAAFPQIKRVVTSTSRPPRGQEKDGVDYHFLPPEKFEAAIKNGDFYEYAKVHDRYYGTSKKEVTEALKSGKDLILIIDVQGASTWREIAKTDPLIAEKMLSVFIAPQSIDILRARLKGRGTESEADIERRMKTALEEFKHKDDFDAFIDSTTMEADFEAMKGIYLGAKQVPAK